MRVVSRSVEADSISILDSARQQASPSSATESSANSGTEEEDHTPSSRAKTSQEGGGDGMVREAFQATTLFGKLPFELICEVSYKVTSRCDVRSLSDRDLPAAQIFSYLDLSDLIQVAHTSSFFAAMLLAPSAQSIWSRSRRNAGYVLFPGAGSEIKFAVTMVGSLCQASSLCSPHNSDRVLPRPNQILYSGLWRPRYSRKAVDGPPVQRLQATAVRFSDAQQTWSDRADNKYTARRVGPVHKFRSSLTIHAQLLTCVEREKCWDPWCGCRRCQSYFLLHNTLRTSSHSPDAAATRR